MLFRHTSKVALVPSAFFDPSAAREMLSRTVKLDTEDKVEYISLPEFSAQLVYSLSDGVPVLYDLLRRTGDIKDYNKIIFSYGEGILELIIAQGDNLLLANTFQASDFTTAQYFLFHAVKKLQINPEVSAVYSVSPLSPDEEMSLYRYFKSVEQL